MPSLPSVPEMSEYHRDKIDFGQAAIAKSQTAVALKLNVNEATTGSMNITGVPAQFDGSIVGLTVILSTNKTAGVMTFTPTINGTAITTPAALTAVAMGNAVKQVVANADAQQPGARFKQGDLLGIKMTTDGSYAPDGTADGVAWLHVVYEKTGA